MTPLAQLLADPAIEVVLHAGRQDVAILRRAWGTEINNIFDTQLAAGFVGASAQTGYGNLLGAILGRRVGKTASYTRWDARPADRRAAELRRRGRRPPARAGRRAPAAADATPAVWSGRARSAGASSRPPTSAIPTPPGSGCPGSGSSIPEPGPWPSELAAWRERTASTEDRPVGSVLADPALVELAKRHPSNLQALEQIRGIHPSGIRRRGAAILEAIAAGMQAPPIPREEGRGRSEPEDAPLIALAEALLRARALDAGLAYELIASRNELELIVGAARRGEPEPDVRTLDGWRASSSATTCVTCSAGRRAISVGPNRRLILGSRRTDLEHHRHRRGAGEHRARQRIDDLATAG